MPMPPPKASTEGRRDRQTFHEMGQIVRALEANGPQPAEELRRVVGATYWEEGRFESQVVPIDAPDLDDEGKPLDTTHTVSRDEGLRETTLEKLGTLKAVAREDGVHTAGSSSQISDGAGALLLTTPERAAELGLTPRARVVDTCLVGVDPVLMLTGPIA